MTSHQRNCMSTKNKLPPILMCGHFKEKSKIKHQATFTKLTVTLNHYYSLIRSPHFLEGTTTWKCHKYIHDAPLPFWSDPTSSLPTD